MIEAPGFRCGIHACTTRERPSMLVSKLRRGCSSEMAWRPRRRAARLRRARTDGRRLKWRNLSAPRRFAESSRRRSRREMRTRPKARSLPGGLAEAALLACLYLALAGRLSWPEAAAALLAGTAAAVLARRWMAGVEAGGRTALGDMPRVGARALGDILVVSRALLLSLGRRPPPQGAERRDPGAHPVSPIVLPLRSIPPNCYVLDADRRGLRLHYLVPPRGRRPS